MNKLKKAMVVGAGIATISGAGFGVATTSAMNGGGHTDSNSNWGWVWKDKRDDNFDAKLAANLSAKFNLDTAEVAAEIEATRDDQFNVLSEKRLEALQKALDRDKIDQEQYDTIVQRLTSVDELYDQLDDLEGEERRELWSQIKDELKELKSWMKDEDISLRLVGFGEVRRHSHHQ